MEETASITHSAPSTSTKLAGGRYIEGIGRRKTATARVRITEDNAGTNAFTVNGKDVGQYFPTDEMRMIPVEPVNKVKGMNTFAVSAQVKGGGIHAQAEAVRHGLSRALVAFEEEWRKRFKKSGLLKRDDRAVERKKFGLKKARKSAQWSKR